jgi:hypothetical protein
VDCQSKAFHQKGFTCHGVPNWRKLCWRRTFLVEPIQDRKKIAQIKNQLCGQRRFRNLLLFVVGVNTALRISDLLELRVELASKGWNV